MNNFYRKFIGFSAKHTYFMLVCLLVVTALELFYIKNNLKIDTDLRALFKGDNEMVLELEKMEDIVGSYSTVLVVAHSPNREKNIEALRLVKEKIDGNPLVRFVEFDRDVEYLEKNALLFATVDELQKVKSEVQNQIAKAVKKELEFDGESDASNENSSENKESTENLTSKMDEVLEKAESYRAKYKMDKFYEVENGTYVAMKVRPAGGETNVSDSKKIVDLLEKAISEVQPEKLGVEVEAGGLFRNKLREMTAIYNDVFSTLAICIILLSLTIIFYFRSLRALLIVFFPLSSGVLSAISAMQFFVGGFNIISAFSFTILYGLGIDFSIHLLGRFSEQVEQSSTTEEALIKSMPVVMPSIFCGAITTVAAFFSLIMIDFKGFSDFGLAAALGVSTSFLAIMIFFPAIVFFFDRMKPLRIKARTTDFLASVYTALSKKSSLVFAVFLVVTALAAVSIKFGEIEYNFDNLSFPGKYDESITNHYRNAQKKAKTDVISTGLPSFIVTNSAEETEDATRTLTKIKAEKSTSIELKDLISIYTFLPEDQEEKIKIIKDIRRLIERKINLFSDDEIERYNKDFKPYLEVSSVMDKEKLPDWIMDKLSLKDGSSDRFIMVALGGNKSDVNDVMRIIDEFGTIRGNINNYKLLGSYMLLSEIKKVIEYHVPLAIVFAFCAVFIVLVLLYRSFINAFVVFLPLAAGILWMILTAVICGIKFNVFNMIIIPTVIGTGIDSAIHIYYRYRSAPEKMIENLKNTGGSVFYSSLTTLVGFGSVALAKHKGLQSIGIMASIGIVTVTLVNLVFFPVIIRWIADSRDKKSKKNV
ncbi:MMPL family transporter [bacterium]|nr:MMPL family transporter [bacterium]